MKTWIILIDGNHYSSFVSKLRSVKHEQTIIGAWQKHFTGLGYPIPCGDISAKVRK